MARGHLQRLLSDAALVRLDGEGLAMQAFHVRQVSRPLGPLGEQLRRLASGEATVTELAEPFAMSLPAVSKHLKVLERAGLVARGRTAQWRPCRLEAAPLAEATVWLERYRRFWEASFDRLDTLLDELQAQDEGGER